VVLVEQCSFFKVDYEMTIISMLRRVKSLPSDLNSAEIPWQFEDFKKELCKIQQQNDIRFMKWKLDRSRSCFYAQSRRFMEEGIPHSAPGIEAIYFEEYCDSVMDEIKEKEENLSKSEMKKLKRT
jgi:hypothetical protein